MDRISPHDIKRLFGDLEDHTVIEILESGASRSQLESVALWLDGEDDVAGQSRAQSGGVAGTVYDLIARELPADEGDEPAPRTE